MLIKRLVETRKRDSLLFSKGRTIILSRFLKEIIEKY